MSNISNLEINSLISVIKEISNDIIIVGHKNADYDSMCSSLALALILKKLKKSVKVYIEKESINEISYFDCNDLLIEDIESNDFTFIALDLNRTSRLPSNMEYYYDKASLTINIDHHNGNSTNANYIVSEPNKSSTCEIIYDISKLLKIKLDREIAELLYTGIISDTNSFLNNASKETFLLASKLISMGIDGEFLINKFYVEKTDEELKAIANIINNLKYDGFHYAVIDMKKEPFKKMRYVDISKKCIPAVFSRNDIKILMIIMDYGDKTKGEIRSRGNIDVSKLAELLTGGGHTNSAGFSNKKSIEEIVEISKEYLESIDSYE